MWSLGCLFVCLAGLAVLWPHAVSADVQQGLDAYRVGDYGRAREVWAGDAETGDPKTQFLLGHLYEQGFGVAGDPEQAYRWYAASAARGYRDAEIARDAIAGRMTPRDLAAARAAAMPARSSARDTARAAIQVAETAGTGDDALRAAVERGEIVTVADLLDAGADPDLRFPGGDPLLLRAIKRNHGDVTLALISAGADVSAADSIGWTPLMIAVFGGQDDLAAILLEEGADPDRESDDGTTARDLAAFREQADLLALMDDPGALAAGPAVPPPPLPEPQPEPQAQAEPEPQLEPEPEPEPDARAEVVPELTLDPDTVPVPAAGPALSETPVAPTRGLVLEVQSRLVGLGYDPGPLDGLLGSRTRAAILAFRSDRGGPADDAIGAALLGALADAETAVAGPRPAEVAWDAVKLSEDPAAIAAYLRAYPDGPVSGLARQRLFELNAGLWGEPNEQDPIAAGGQGGQARSSTVDDLERYLVRQRALFQAELNAYNKRHRIKASGNRSTFKVRNLYEASVIAEQDGLYRVNVLFGVGNWSSQAKDADLNVSRMIVLVRPAGRGYRIVGHSEDLTELSRRP